MGNTPDLFDIRKPCKTFHKASSFVSYLRVLNCISTWETLLIQILFCLKPLKIIGINPCSNIGLRYITGRLNKNFAVCLTAIQLKLSKRTVAE
jgi:hypothetical protein